MDMSLTTSQQAQWEAYVGKCAEEVDDLDEVLNESIMDSIVGKRKAAEARSKKKRKRRADDDDDDDDEEGYGLCLFSSTYRMCYV